MTRVWAVVNQKGGVGKTTCTINLAAALASGGQHVLVVDMDPQSNATSGLGLPWAQVHEGSCALIAGDVADADAVVACCRPTAQKRLHVLPAGPELTAVQMGQEARGSPLSRLRSALAGVKGSYDAILIDCPPSLGMLTLGALCAADAVIVPTICEYFALEGLSQLVRTLQVVRQTHHPGLALEGIVLTMFDGRNRLAHQVAAQIDEHFGPRVFSQRIPRNVRVGEAPSHGLPVTIYDPQCSGARAYLRLCAELRRRQLPAKNAELGRRRPRRRNTTAQPAPALP